MQGFSWVLIIVTVIVAALAVLTALYLLVYYQHPEDKNQASSRCMPAIDWQARIQLLQGRTSTRKVRRGTIVWRRQAEVDCNDAGMVSKGRCCPGDHIGYLDGLALSPGYSKPECLQLQRASILLHFHPARDAAVVLLLHSQRGPYLCGHPLRHVLL